MREMQGDHEAQDRYLDYLRLWLHDRSYISPCCMTGILPVKKCDTHSALNMFSEFRILGAYGPRSVVRAMETGDFASYWNEAVSHIALQRYIDLDMDGLRGKFVRFVAGGRAREKKWYVYQRLGPSPFCG